MSRLVAIVAAHFVPSNLTGVHRSRLWVPHLPDFGWQPTIVTTDPAYYEETLVPELEVFLPDQLPIIRTRALPTPALRIMGDIGIRGFYWHYRALCRLAEEGLDFIHITIPSFYSALLGRLVYKRYGVPYGIDYIDPWVHDFPVPDVPFGWLKAWGATQLASLLEPWAVRDASLITGVAASYYEQVLGRNPHLRTQAVTAAMPYGGAARDQEVVRAQERSLFLWPEDGDAVNLLYAGAMLPKAYTILRRLFEACRKLQSEYPDLMSRVRLHFVGTGSSPTDPDGHNVRPIAQEESVADLVHEHPARIPYMDVLSHLQAADGALIVGSTERHYTPSKTFQAVQARCPLFALLHEESSATQIIRESRAGRVVSFAEGTLPSVDAIASALMEQLTGNFYDQAQVRWELYEQYSARNTTRVLAAALDAAYTQFHARSR